VREYTLKHLEAAINYIDCDDRLTWVKTALALKTSFGDDAFPIWDDWSAKSTKYNEKVARLVWRSGKAGKLTAGSVFKQAKDRGWTPDSEYVETDEIRRERDARNARRAAQLEAEQAELALYHELVADHSAELWGRLHKVGTSKYLGEKRVVAKSVLFATEPMISVIRKDEVSAKIITDRVEINSFLADANKIPRELRPFSYRYLKRGCFAVPLFDIDGKLWSLQIIWPTGTKTHFYNARKSGCFHIIGEHEDYAPGAPIAIVEGFSTGASIHMATGWKVVVAFDTGNLMSVARAMRTAHSGQPIIICADNDVEQEGNPGVTKATEAALAIGAHLYIPDFSKLQAAA